MLQPRHYWLIKSEPDECSIDDAMAAPKATVAWTGVRNYQARNFMRDAMRIGDGVLFYHSSCADPGVAGIACVAVATLTRLALALHAGEALAAGAIPQVFLRGLWFDLAAVIFAMIVAVPLGMSMLTLAGFDRIRDELWLPIIQGVHQALKP